MTIAITAAQRDALYDQILDRLSGIDDVWLAAEAEDFAAAERLGREYSDDLRLLSDDLGWGPGGGGTVTLSAPPDVLRRALSRLRDAATGHAASQRRERIELEQSEQRDQLVVEACRQVLSELDGETPRPPTR